MPVTRFHTSVTAPAASGPAPTPPPMPAAAAAEVAAGVGHGTTRLLTSPPALGHRARFVPGAPPPRGETAGAHGAHKGRISVRY
jgi:hypothetical protein